jgi:hypothetical protein
MLLASIGKFKTLGVVLRNPDMANGVERLLRYSSLEILPNDGIVDSCAGCGL